MTASTTTLGSAGPARPEAMRTTVSLVEVQPSTVIELNESRTAIRSRSASGPGSTAASVVRKANMVAMSGASMPAPLAMPATVKVGLLDQHLLGAGVGGEDAGGRLAAAAAADPERAATSGGMPASIGPMGSGMPISPVEHTRICSVGTPSPARPARTSGGRRPGPGRRWPRWRSRC